MKAYIKLNVKACLQEDYNLLHTYSANPISVSTSNIQYGIYSTIES